METDTAAYDLSTWNTTDEMLMNSSNGTDVLSCSEKRFLGRPLPFDQTTSDVFRYTQIFFLIIAFPVGFILNSLVIFLIIKFKSLRQTTFYLALQVVIVDLLLSVIVFPTTVANIIADRWLFGEMACPGIGFFSFTLRNLRNFFMFVFVTDRLLTVFAPFWYYRKMNRQYVIVPLTIAAWTFGIIYGIIPIVLGCHDYNKIAWSCTVNKGCIYPEVCNAYKISSVVVSNIIGGLIPLVMYSILFYKSRQIRKRYKFTTAPEKSSTSDNTDDTSASGMSELKRNTEGKRRRSIVASLLSTNSTNSNANVIRKRIKKGERATTTFAVLFVALAGLSFPSTFFFVIGQSAFVGVGVPPPTWFTGITIVFRFLFNFIVIIDPIAIMRNRDITTILKESFLSLKFRILKQARPVEATDYNNVSASNVCRGSVDDGSKRPRFNANLRSTTLDDDVKKNENGGTDKHVSYNIA